MEAEVEEPICALSDDRLYDGPGISGAVLVSKRLRASHCSEIEAELELLCTEIQ
jgi:hypothetical protein